MDIVVLCALATAVSFAVADLLIRAGLQHTHAFIGSVLSQGAQLGFFFVLAPVLGFDFPPLGPDYLWVMAGGVGQPALFSIFFMIGISKIGVSRAASIKGISPLFAAALAILFLGERPAWFHLAGVLLVVAGVALVSSGRTEGRWRRADALWPVLAALAGAAGAICWRRGLPGFPNPLAAVVVALGTAFPVVAAFAYLYRHGRPVGDIRRALPPFLLCGAVAGAAHIFFAIALQRGEIYRVVPLVQVSPIFTVILALILLRRAEFITWRVPSGALLIVAGAVLVTLKPTG